MPVPPRPNLGQYKKQAKDLLKASRSGDREALARIAEILLQAGAEIDAVGEMYGGATALELVATSVHPVRTGVQIELIDTLLDHGAAVERVAGATVNSCLANGRREAAEHLAEHGGVLDLEGAAGVGAIHRGETGLHWAAYGGHVEIVAMLLERPLSQSGWRTRKCVRIPGCSRC